MNANMIHPLNILGLLLKVVLHQIINHNTETMVIRRQNSLTEKKPEVS